MALQFFLTYRGVRVPAKEPALDWKSIAQILKKSTKYDGITYLITSELEFANNFVNILDQVKANGIAESVILEVFSQVNDTREWEQAFIGKVDIIGSVKTISATGLEKYKVNTKPTGFEVYFDNNFDTSVNITDDTDLFGNPILPFARVADYVKLEPLSIKQRLDIENELPNLYDGGSAIEIDASPDNYVFFWTMNFGTQNIQEFGDNFQANSTLQYDDSSYHPAESLTNEEIILDSPNSPINNSLEILKVVTPGDYRVQFDYAVGLDVNMDDPDQHILRYRYVMAVVIVNREDPLNPVLTIDLLNETYVSEIDNRAVQFNENGSIDKTYTLTANDTIYTFPFWWVRIHDTRITSKAAFRKLEIDFTVLSLKIDATTKFEETNPQAYMIHELWSRLINKTTGQFNAFESNFYGRTDSEPRTYDEDGEGSLTAILGGTHLRGWTIGTGGGSERTLNLSLAELFESESAKHNLGIGIIDGVVRIEKAEFFVDKDNYSVNLGCIREMEIQTEPKSFFNQFEFGYSEWKNSENKTGAGLQEFNAKTNYNPQLGEINSKYLAVSKFIAAGYTIETTRRQQRSLDSEKETQFDLKKFMIALLRTLTPINLATEDDPAFVNETYDPLDSGNPWSSVAGVDFPEEVYNVRWQPARMARNHGNKIRLSVQQNSNDELLAQSVDGNKLFNSQLKTESVAIYEGQNILGSDLGDALFTGQKHIFTTSLSDDQIESLKTNPLYHLIFTDAKGNSYKAAIEGDLSLPFETNLGEFTLKEIYDVVISPGLYSFFGIETITIAGVPAFEKTSTFIYKAKIKSKVYSSGDPSVILWSTQTGATAYKGLQIMVYGDGYPTFGNRIQVFISNNKAASADLIEVLTDPVLSSSEFKNIQVNYDGSGNASGVTIKIDDVSVTVYETHDTLTGSVSTGTGAVVGDNKVSVPDNFGIIMSSFEWVMNSILYFKTQCANNGLTCIDLSGQENDGVIDLDTTDPNDFFLTE